MTKNVYDQMVAEFMAKIIAKNPGEKEFHQAVQEVAESLIPFIEENPKYKAAKILERIAEPERVIMFRVPWLNDKGEFVINRGFRIQMNSAIGPYKGGLRFHPSVTMGILKFLAFEQVFKNSLAFFFRNYYHHSDAHVKNTEHFSFFDVAYFLDNIENRRYLPTSFVNN